MLARTASGMCPGVHGWVIFFVFGLECVCLFEAGFLCTALAVQVNSLLTRLASGSQSLSASASQVLGLKQYTAGPLLHTDIWVAALVSVLTSHVWDSFTPTYHVC